MKTALKNTTSPYVFLRRSSIHGRGVFAKKDIPKGTCIIEYVGEKVTHKESDRRADIVLKRSQRNKEYGAVYIFSLNKRYDIDGNVPYNSARYINHSCEPNAEAEIDGSHIWIVALCDIKEGEEIYYNYGYDFDDYKDHPCFCRTRSCVGFIMAEEYWPRLRRHLKKRREKRAKVSVN